MKLTRKVAAVVALAAIAGSTHIATATAEPPARPGYDDLADQIVGGGSDTTFYAMQGIDRLYARSPGCKPIIDQTSSIKGQCDPAEAVNGDEKGNWDHDLTSEAVPVGSTAGVRSILSAACGGTGSSPSYDYARSSSSPFNCPTGSPNAGQSVLNELTYWGYGKDGIAVQSYGTRVAGNLTASDLYAIWNCDYTDWSQIPGYTGAAGPIEPWGMQTSSGTYNVFRDYVRANSVPAHPTFDPNAGACVKKLPAFGGSAASYPFENDVKQQIAGPDRDFAATGDNIVGAAQNGWIWWGSSGEFDAFSYKRQSGKKWTVNGVSPDPGTISDNSYPITRVLNHVTKDVDATYSNPNITGGSGGKSGAVLEFTRFICNTSANQTIDPFNGKNYFSAINDALAETGFVAVPAFERSAGTRCKIQT